jgi:hypothetical protein
MKILSLLLFVVIVPKHLYAMTAEERNNNATLMQEGYEFQLASRIQEIPNKEIREEIIREALALRETQIPHVHLSSDIETPDYARAVPLSMETRFAALKALAAQKEGLLQRARLLVHKERSNK